ncbi:DNA topoisomerase 2-like isoform X4 [Nilaparvata lugens]|nr:DNA topoisomerase 2-like isoform X4 [Nilaparvata lugens]XP_039283673.1 DNA topoisomerase 2-like isoform X4 [Nilaparvata lugens]
MDAFLSNGKAAGGDAGNKTPTGKIEKQYQKKSQLEHILLRPDTYIGSVEHHTEQMWVYDSEKNAMEKREITYVPGLFKIFDEILVNAADNKQRDPTMNTIKIEIKPEENVISIYNNGEGIPVVLHKEQKMYVPTMIFGHLLTSSNYNDEDDKVTGGRNGYGAKLCNIFSSSFIVETSSKEYKKSFRQKWADNMSKTSEPEIKEDDGDFTKVTFSPDLSKFKMDKLDKDIVDLMSRRAYDVAASTGGVKVFLNGKNLQIKTFKDYVDLYTKDKLDDDENPLKIVHERFGARWEVAVTLSDQGFQQISFVNSIATTKGGRHVDYVVNMIVKNIVATMKKKNRGGMDMKPFQIKNHLWVFINCLIVNPTFDSQTKENMTSQEKNFGSKCVLTDKFIAGVLKCGIVETLLVWAKTKEQEKLQKASGKKQTRLKGIPKLEDANDAGKKDSVHCTLILTEGDSAKTLAVSGLGVIGRDRYGVFPLRGKVLNVREASHKQILENAEINAIIKITGLQHKKKYETFEDMKTLRYGKIMIMTDQDQDGSHIKGLLINFLHFYWPSLLKMNFIEQFITPLIKATKKQNVLSFFSIPEFEEWKRGTDDWHTYKIKYYKGLGTSDSKEAKEYFSNMERHKIKFKYTGEECDKAIQMAFSKKQVEARKEWLTNWMVESKRRQELGLPEEYLYGKDTKVITYKEFINKELILFSHMDIERSIPSAVDGLKPGSRKVLFTCLKRNDKREIKVAQLAGSVAEQSAYHHGEVSLMSTIINLAQNYVGSNNINLLQPLGQFGTRLQGGKDAASPRYIFTMLNPLTRLIFHPDDDPLLKYLKDDNLRVEPQWYMPVIPMLLVNGAEGIGTGWMTKIPNHNPREIVANIKRMMQGEEPLPMKPWYKNFLGEIDPLGLEKFVVNGEVGIISDTRLEITELPVGTWTQNYKESVLEPMLHGADKTPACITEYKEYNTDATVKFVITMSADKLAQAENEGLHKFFKLQTLINITSMCAFDKDNCLKRYTSAIEVLKEFFPARMLYYEKRKDNMAGTLEAETRKLSNQARFICEKCDGTLVIENKKKKDMVAELIRRKFDPDPVKEWKMKKDREAALEEAAAAPGLSQTDDDGGEGDEEGEERQNTLDSNFDYLLGMAMWNLTKEKKDALIQKKDEKQQEYRILLAKTPQDLWVADLDTLIEKLDEYEAKERAEMLDIKVEGGKGAKGGAKKGGARNKNKVLVTDYLPSPIARRVAPVISDEFKKKVEKAAAAKENKGKSKARKKLGDEEVDEFDLMSEKNQVSLSDRIANTPAKKAAEKKPRAKKAENGEKKPRKPRGTKGSPKKKSKAAWESSSEDGGNSDDSDASEVLPVSPVRQTARRSVAPKKYNFDDDADDDDDDEDVLYDNDAAINGDEDAPVVENDLDDNASLNGNSSGNESIISDSDTGKAKSALMPAKKQRKPAEKKPKAAAEKKTASQVVKAFSDSDDSDNDFMKPSGKAGETSEDKFDSLIAGTKKKTTTDIFLSSSEDSSVAKPKAAKKAAEPKPKKAPAKRTKKAASGSDSDSPVKAKKPKKKAAKSAFGGDSSDEDFGFALSDDPPARTPATTGRARKQVKNNYGGDDDDESD